MSLVERLVELAAAYRAAVQKAPVWPGKDAADAIVELIEEVEHRRFPGRPPLFEVEKPGWVEIGMPCSAAGRRSVWMKVHWASPEAEERGYASLDAVRAIEFRAGREGDDAHVIVDQDNPQFAELLNLALVAAYAADT